MENDDLDQRPSDLLAVGQRIAAVRMRSGLTQDAFAKALGYAKRTVTKWERSEIEPHLASLRALQRVFRVDLNWLMQGPSDEPVYLPEPLAEERLEFLTQLVRNLAFSEGLTYDDEILGQIAAGLAKVPAEEFENELKALRLKFRKVAVDK